MYKYRSAAKRATVLIESVCKRQRARKLCDTVRGIARVETTEYQLTAQLKRKPHSHNSKKKFKTLCSVLRDQ